MSAKRLRDRRDQPDFSGSAISESILTRGFAPLVRDLNQRPSRVNTLMNLGGWNDETSIPIPVSIQRHKLDEAHHESPLASKFSEGFDFVVVDASDQHRVHFRRRKRRRLSGTDAAHHRVEGLGARNLLELRE